MRQTNTSQFSLYGKESWTQYLSLIILAAFSQDGFWKGKKVVREKQNRVADGCNSKTWVRKMIFA